MKQRCGKDVAPFSLFARPHICRNAFLKKIFDVICFFRYIMIYLIPIIVKHQ